MASSSGQGVAAVMLPRFSTTGDPRRNCEKFVQMFKDWCELNGWYDNEPPPEEPEEGEDPVPVEPKWLAKGKALAAFRSAIAGNEELENLVHGFQLSDEEAKEPNVILKHLQEHFKASEGLLTERTKFAQMKQEDQESVTAWEGRVKEQGRRLEYCNKCEDQLLRDKFISGINNERLMSKLLDKGHRDKTTKEIVSFKTMLQVAKNFEQCEKAKAIMQQAKGPTEQVNYTGPRSPSSRSKTGVRVTTEAQRHPQSPSKTGVKIFLTASAKLAPVSIVQVRHTLAPNAQLQTSDALGRAVGESDTLPVHAEWGLPLYPAPPRHTILMPL